MSADYCGIMTASTYITNNSIPPKSGLRDIGSPKTIAGQQTIADMFPNINFADFKSFPVRFGDITKPIKGLGHVNIPWRDKSIRVGIIPGRLPLLIGKDFLAESSASISVKSGRATIYGRRVQLLDSGKHLYLPLSSNETQSWITGLDRQTECYHADIPDNVFLGEVSGRDHISNEHSYYYANHYDDILDAIEEMQLHTSGNHTLTGPGGAIYFNLGSDETETQRALQAHRSLACASVGKTSEALKSNGMRIPRALVEQAIKLCGCPGSRLFTETPKSRELFPTTANQHVYGDVIYWSQKKYLLLVDAYTRFCMMIPIENKAAATVFRAYFENWYLLFGKAKLLIFGAGKEFEAQEFEQKASDLGAPVKILAPESQHSNYAERIWRIVQTAAIRLQTRHNPKDSLILATVAYNSTTSGGYSPFQRTLGINPVLEAPDTEQNVNDHELMKKIASIAQAQSEISLNREKYIVRQNLKKACAPHSLKVHDSVRIYRKQDKSFSSAGIIESVGSGLVNVRIGKKLVSAHPRFAHRITDSGDRYPLTYEFTPTDESYYVYQANDEDFVSLTQSSEKEFLAHEDGVKAIKKELNGLLEKEVVEYIKVTDIPRDAQILPLIWAHNIKDNGRYRARCCVRGDLEWFETLKSDCPTVKRSTVRWLISEGLSDKATIHLIDFEMAFMQGNKLSRCLYGVIRDPISQEKKYVKIVRPLYGLKDAAYQWYSSLTEWLEQQGFRRSVWDRSLFVHKNGCRIAVYIDDMLILSATPEFLKALQSRFKIGSIEEFNEIGTKTDFCGLILERVIGGITAYAKTELKLKEIEGPESFWSALGLLLWVAGATRPDVAFEVSDLSTRGPDSWRDLNKCIRTIQKRPMQTKFVPLGKDRRIIGFCDACHPRDKKAQIGRIIFSEDGAGRSNLLHWTSTRSKLVCGSSTSAELVGIRLGLEDVLGFSMTQYEKQKEIPLTIWKDECELIHEILSEVRPQLRTDSNNIVTKSEYKFTLPENTHLISFMKIKQLLSFGVELIHITRHQNVADCLTKHFARPELLMSVFARNKCSFKDSDHTQGQRRKKVHAEEEEKF